MKLSRRSVSTVVIVPDPLPPAIARPREHVDAVLAQSLLEVGEDGRAALAWAWALTGTRPSPITLNLAPGPPPSREEILAEADADPEGSTTPHGVPTDYCAQFGEARGILTWLTGISDEIPLDDDQRGRLIGARDDYARTDTEIRQVRDNAARSLAAIDLSEPMEPVDTAAPWRWTLDWMAAVRQRGIRDLLDWILGDRPDAPLSHRAVVGLPTVYDLTYEETAANDVIAQDRPVGSSANPAGYPPPQCGEAIRATIAWLRGEITSLHVYEQEL